MHDQLESDALLVSGILFSDRNSKYFHKLHNVKKAQSKIYSMYVNDELIDNTALIGEHVVAYYTCLFKEDHGPASDFPVLDDFPPTMVSQDQNLLLVACPSDDEIKTAVFDMEASSSMWPYRFGGSFYQYCWDIIVQDII
ncbi:hypothetical protein ACS0TY_033585 [Phlomoides rotata]